MNKVVKRGNLKRTDFMTTISDRKIINNMVHYKVSSQEKPIKMIHLIDFHTEKVFQHAAFHFRL